MTAERLPSLASVPLRHIALVTLTFQNSCLILVMHYSRIMPLVDGHRYYTSTAVLLNEVIKLSISVVVAAYEIIARETPAQQTSPAPGLITELWRLVFSSDSWKLAIPAMLYTLQNSLQYVAVSNLDAATYQVLSQLKILTTALFSVTLLGRSLSVRKWIALVILMAGVGIVQIPPESLDKLRVSRSVVPAVLHVRSALRKVLLLDDSITSHSLAARAPEEQLNSTVGLIAVAIGCMLSGLAGVYFEKVLKDPKSTSSTPSLWIRNIQLSFYSLFPALFVGVLFKDGANIAQTGFFYGYNFMTWMAILSQSTGGILVAIVVKYADNIAKNFATSFSIIVSFLASVYFFNFRITYFYLVGTALVIGATYLFNTVPTSKQQESQPAFDEERGEPKESREYDVEMDHVSAAKEPLLSGADSSEKHEAVLPARRSSEVTTKREA